MGLAAALPLPRTLPEPPVPDRARILVVEDERDLADLVRYNLARAGYDVTVVHDGREALDAVRDLSPDLVLLDLMIPEIPGHEVARRLRGSPATADLPIVMLTARSEEQDQVAGLSAGADDYITKPFSLQVLRARIEAVLRRAAKPAGDSRTISLGPVDICLDTHEARVDGASVRLTLTEFRLLAALMQARGKVLDRASLIARAIGPGITVTERTIDVHLTSVRKRLGPHAGMIKTVRGVGYRMTEDAGED